MIQMLPDFSEEELVSLFEIYRNLKNESMVDSLLKEANRRDPKLAAKLRESVPESDPKVAPTPKMDEPKQPSPPVRKPVVSRSKGVSVQSQLARQRHQRASYERHVSEAMQKTYDQMHLGHREESLALAEGYLATYPNEPRIQMLYGQALAFNWRFTEAQPLLSNVKEKHYRNRPFPAEAVLGETYLAMGDIEAASTSYLAAAACSLTVHADEQEFHQRILRDLRPHLDSSIAPSFEYLSLSEGDGFTLRNQVTRFIHPRTRIGVRSFAHQVELSDERILKMDDGEMKGANAYARQRIGDFHFAEARIGGVSPGGVSGGFSYGREAFHQRNWFYEAYVDAKKPLTDSLQAIALAGLQDVAGFRFEGPLNPDLTIRGGGYFRTAELDEADLGEGYGFHGEIRKALWRDHRERSGIYGSLSTEYQRFDADNVTDRQLSRLGLIDRTGLNQFADSIIEEEFFPVGAHLSAELEVSRDVAVFGRAGSVWDFADEEWIHEVSGGLNWNWTEKSDLTVSLAYQSGAGGRGGIIDEDESVFVGSIGVKYYF